MTAGEWMTGLGFVTGGWVLWAEAERRRLNTEGMRLIGAVGLLGGVLGARLTEWTVTGNWGSLATAIFDPSVGGKAILGGLLSGWGAVWAMKRRLGIRRGTGDLWALAIPAGEAVGRVGCFLNGCCYGTEVPEGFPMAVWQHGHWRHPAQLYSAATVALLFGGLWWYSRQVPEEGKTWQVFLVSYPTARFLLEFYRERPLVGLGLSLVQWMCLETVTLVTALNWWRNRRAGATES